jgi:hypothetical protein
MLTTKLLILLVGGGAVIGAVSTRIASDLMSSGAALPAQPCTVIYVPPQPQRPREPPVGLGKFSDLFKEKR